MSLRFSEEWLLEYQQKHKAANVCDDQEPDYGPESELQWKAENWIEENGYYCFHDRSKGKNKPGFLDLVIALPRAVTVWMELKSHSGRMTPEQTQTTLRLMAMGHRVYKNVRSYKRFLEIMGENLEGGK